MQNKVIFYSKDMTSYLPTDLPSLGLLQAVEGLTLYSKSLSYNFLHLSVQELLAAYHILQMSSSEQFEVFKKLLGSYRFQAVLHYYCGFTKLTNLEIQKFISSYQQNGSTLKEILPLLHCFFEAQQPSLCQLVDPRFIQDAVDSIKLIPSDFLAVGYFIISLLSTSTTAQTEFLSIKNIDDHCLKLLLSELSKYPLPTTGGFTGLSGKLVLHLETPSITGLGLKYISSHLKHQFTVFSDIALIQLSDAAPQKNSTLIKHIQLQYFGQTNFAFNRMLEVGSRYAYQIIDQTPEFSEIVNFVDTLLSTHANLSNVCL